MRTASVRRVVVGGLLVCGLLGTAQAQNYTNIASGLWSNANSWASSVPPTGGVYNAILIFTNSGTVNSTNNLADASKNFVLNQLIFTNSKGALTIFAGAGTNLVFTNSGATLPRIWQNATNTLTFNHAITLATNTTFLGSGNQLITLNSNVTGVGAMFVNLTNFNLSGNLQLSTSNSFQGGLVVSNGAVNVNNLQALGTNTARVVAGSIIFKTAGTYNNNFIIAGTGSSSSGALRASNVAVTVAGSVTLSNNATINSYVTTFTENGAVSLGNYYLTLNPTGGSNVVNGSITGAGGIIAGGTGLVLLTNANNYTGGTIINSGRLQFDNASALPISGFISNNVGGALVVKGPYVTINDWLNSGRLAANSAGALALIADNAETVNMTTYSNLSIGAASGSAVTFTGTITPGVNGYFFGGGGGTITSSVANTFTGPGVNVTFGNGGGGTVVLAADNDASGTATIAAGTVQLGIGGAAGWLSATSFVNNGTLIFNRSDLITNTAPISGTGGLTKSGAGTLTLAGTNTYAGTTYIYDGAISITGSNTWTGTANTDFYQVHSNGVLNISGDFYSGGQFRIGYEAGTTATVNQTAGTFIGAGTYGQLIGNTVNGGVGIYNLFGGVLSNAAGAELTLGVNTNTTGIFNLYGGTLYTPTLEIGRNTGAASGTTNFFNQSGGTATIGTLTMGRSNADSPNQFMNLLITNGIFSATAFNTLAPQAGQIANLYFGTGAVVTLPAFPARGAGATVNLTFDGGALSPYAASANYMSNLTRAVITSKGAIFNVTSGNDITIAQALENATGQSGGLTKTGLGALTLTGANTYSNGTTISGGSLVFGAGALPAVGNILLTGGGLAASGPYTSVTNWLASGRIDPASVGAIAIVGDNNEAIDFTTGNFSNLFLGAAVGSTGTFSGTLTFFGTTYRLGGGGGTLNFPSAIGAGSNVIVGALGGIGTVVFTNINTYTDATVFNSGALNINADTALGAAPSVPTTNLIFNGDSTLQFANSFAVDTNRTILINNGVTATFEPQGTTNIVPGVITGAGGLNKLGTGLLVLSGANGYSGGTLINAGILNINADTALGIVPGSAATNITFSGNGTLQFANTFDLATNRMVLVNATTITATLDTQAHTNSIPGGILGGGRLIKQGSGTLTLAGSNTIGNTTINAGVLNFDIGSMNALGTVLVGGASGPAVLSINGVTTLTGNMTNGNTAGDRSVVMLTANATMAKMYVGLGNGVAGATIQNGGAVIVGPTTSGTDVISLGNSSGYGYYQMNGGTLTVGQLSVGGSTGGNGVFDQYGGTTTVSAASGWLLLNWNGGTNVMNVYNGSLIAPPGNNDFSFSHTANKNGFAMVNLLGAGAFVDATGGSTNRGVDLSGYTGNLGAVLNLNNGVLVANRVRSSNPGTTPTYLNFNGGTLLAGTNTNYGATFLQGLTAVNIYAGGATIDTANNTITIGQNLLGPTGSGITNITLANNGGGYIGAPALLITGGSGTGATAIAQADLNPSSGTYGQVTNILVTCAGSGYLTNDVLTVLFIGGGYTNAAAASTPALAPNISGGLTKLGGGTLTLTGMNTFSGTTMISGGTLVISNQWALQNSTLNYSTGTAIFGAGIINYTLGGLAGSTSLDLTNASGSAIALAVGGNNANTTYSGVLAQGGSLIKIGTGSLSLVNANTYSGGTIISNGTLAVNNPTGLATGPGDVNIFSGGILQGTGAVAAVVVNSLGHVAPGNNIGTLTMSNLTMNPGSLYDYEFNLGHPQTNDQIIVLGDVTVNSGAFNFYEEGTTTAWTTNGLYNLIRVDGLLSGLLGNLSVNTAPSKTYTFGTNGVWITVDIADGTFIWNGSDTVDSFWSTTNNWVTRPPDAGNVPLVFGGSLRLINTNDFAANTKFAGITFATDAGAFVLEGNAVNLTSAVENNSPNLQTINLPLVLDGFSRPFNAYSNSLVINGEISETSGSWAVLKNGDYFLTLTASNTYSGGTFINGGTLVTSNASALGSGPVAITNSMLQLAQDLIIGDNLSGSGATVDLGAYTLTINQGGNSTFAGAITNTGALFKNGTGTLTLVGTNTYTGGTLISAGTLQLGDGTALNGLVAGAITNNAALIFANPADQSYGGVISGSGALTKNAAGTLTLTGANTYGGGTFLNAGTLNVTNDAALGAPGGGLTFNGGTLQSSGDMTLNNRAITLTGAGTNIVDAGTTLTITNNISGAGGLTKRGAGTLTLGGANTYAGVTYIYDGVVNITGSNGWTGTASTDFYQVRSNAVLNISGDFYSGGQFRIGYEAGTTAIVNQTAGTFMGAGTYGQLIGNSVGSTVVGIYNLYGGMLSNAASSELVLGVNNNNSGIFNMFAGILTTPTLEIGRNTSGTAAFTTNYFNQSGGAAAVTTLYMGGTNAASTNQISNLLISNGVFSVTTFSTFAPVANDIANIYLGTGAVVTLPAFPTVHNGGATATLTFDGGTLSPYAASANYMSNLTAVFLTTNGAKFDVGSGKDITIAQPLTNAAGQNGILIKQGAGVLTLSGANTYSGGTVIQIGTLQAANAGALPGYNTPNMLTVSNGATLAINYGGVSDWTSPNVDGLLANSNAFAVGSALVFDTSNGNGVYTNAITISGLGVIKRGANTLTLSGANAYGGGTLISAGSLVLNNNDALGTGALVMTSTVVRVTVGDGVTITNAIAIYNNSGASGRGLLEYAGTGTGTFSGPITINNGAAAGGHFGSTGGGTLIISGPITSSVAVVSRVGTIVYSGGGSYSDFTISQDTTKLGANNGLATNAVLYVAASAAGIFDLAGFNQTLAGVRENTAFTRTITNTMSATQSVLTLGNTNPTNFLYSGTLNGNLALLMNGTFTQTLSGTTIKYTGPTTINGGVLALSNTTAFVSPTTITGGQLLLQSTTAVQLATITNAIPDGGLIFSATANSYTLGGLTGTGNVALTNAAGANVALTLGNNNANLTYGGALSQGGNLIKVGTGTLVLSGSNSYTGGTLANSGVLQLSSSNALPTSGSLTNYAIVVLDYPGVQAAVDRVASSSTGTLALTTTSAGENINLATVSLASNSFLGTMGAVTYTGNYVPYGTTYRLGGGGGTLTYQGTMGGASNLVVGSGVGGGVVVLTAANTFTGGTLVNNGGTLRVGATDTLPTTGMVTLGDASGAGNLDLSSFNQTMASLLIASTSSTQTNVVIIGTGQTLTINGTGGLTNGVDLGGTSSTTTRLTMSGGGALVITNTSAYVVIGKSQASQNSNNSGILDLAGLSSVTLGSSGTAINELRVGYGLTAGGTLTLSDSTNTITATTVRIGQSVGNAGPASTLILGVGVNELAVDTINIGLSKGSGTLRFASQTNGSPGTVTIGGKTGVTTDFVIGSKTATGTGSTPVGTLDLRGHTVNVTAGTVTLGKEDGAATYTSGATGYLYFDSGAFTASNLIMAAKSGNSTGTALAVMTVSGDVFTVQSGGSVSLASQTGQGYATGTLTVAGSGTFRSNADIRDGGGNAFSTLNLAGGTLDMMGHNIGSASQSVDVFNAQSGILQNLGQLNNGAPLVKTTSGTLTMLGNNNYSGGTLISDGTLQLGDSTANNGSVLGNITNNANLVFANPNTQAFGGVISGSGTLTKNAAGTLTLSGTNTYSGTTTINGGTLLINGTQTSGGLINVLNGGTLGGTGILGNVTVYTGGVFQPGNGGAGTQMTGMLSMTGGLFRATLVNSNSFSQVVVANTLSISSAHTNYLELVLGSYTSESNATYLIIKNDSLVPWTSSGNGLFTLSDQLNPGLLLTNGMVFQAVGGSISATNTFRINYDFDADHGTFGTGNDILLSVIPEPTSVNLLLMIGSAYGLCRGLYQRKRRRDV